MKTRIIKFAFTIAMVFFVGSALAYEEETKEEICKKPKYTDFTLPIYQEPEKNEAAPESEFEFKVSAWADPKTIKLFARQENIPFTVESTSTFHRVKAKLPASLNGKFARINASVKAVLGCDEQHGWLVKISDKKSESTTPNADQPATETSPAEAPAEQTDLTAPATESPASAQ